MMKLWDALDKLPLQTVETIMMELDGRLLGDGDTVDKILRSQIQYYHGVRIEQETQPT